MDIAELEQLIKDYEVEKDNFLIQKTLMDSASSLNLDKLDLDDECKDKLSLSQHSLNASDYLKLDNSNSLLGLDSSNCSSPDLTHSEEKNFHRHFYKEVEKICNANIEFVEDKEFEEKFNIYDLSLLKNEILDMVTDRNAKIERLTELHAERLELLEWSAQLKAGLSQTDDMEELYLDAESSDLQATVLRDLMAQEICHRTDDASKAFQRVRNFIEEMDNQKK